ncbi:MAG TPA: COX15/CtaA family protein [Chitinophagales bacterium]|nr:COX15/CtaA family protein [Chitinophagales bacterium]
MKAIRLWLWTGAFMVLVQVMLGGITRLTGSGLSITEWDVLMGALPPLNAEQWNEAFDQYKQFPQYELVNSDMDLPGFKSIFWWEYIHRNWARLIGLVFLIPFLYFWFSGRLNKAMRNRFLVVFLLGGLQGFMGWIMVASGLIDKPWVSPYNLTMHLLLALLVFLYLIWLALSMRKKPVPTDHPVAAKHIRWVLGIIVVQIAFGGFMAGTKAGLLFQTWPLMNGTVIPPNAFHGANAMAAIFDNPTTINFVHRTLGILVFLAVGIFWLQNRRFSAPSMRRLEHALLLMVFLQFLLGVTTLLLASTHIPVFWGVVHQLGAFILAGIATAILYYARPRKPLIG